MGTAITAVDATSRPKLSRHVRFRFDRTRDRHVLLGPETVVVLNGTGADIVGLCDGARTAAEIVAELRGRYHQVVDEDVLRFLARLAARRCLELSNG
ncbi:pyrroloquinoline quinone biosynthesis peptide chaperone PqqD [Amycolatopsis taiwanensis]|uniref:Pyrroloquinoline quinone biosynthesis protein PqqD n=1 Tax=Amycolatopsis taiwanensis TaxID=342230 RepID=A0A9W6R6D7_9PSEU|nr:pyrroloquinoline quinone biosynthesis peptide chaperone PqqD [Amycolatopsis taiwanensis]GLY70264.1 hypothetical protein Atai01_68830 [Amycolatopsis taiwanensis]